MYSICSYVTFSHALHGKELKTYFKQATPVLAEVSDIRGAAIQGNKKNEREREREKRKNCNRIKIAFS